MEVVAWNWAEMERTTRLPVEHGSGMLLPSSLAKKTCINQLATPIGTGTDTGMGPSVDRTLARRASGDTARRLHRTIRAVDTPDFQRLQNSVAHCRLIDIHQKVEIPSRLGVLRIESGR